MIALSPFVALGTFDLALAANSARAESLTSMVSLTVGSTVGRLLSSPCTALERAA